MIGHQSPVLLAGRSLHYALPLLCTHSPSNMQTCGAGAMGVGGGAGAYLAKKMNITDLPQMVAGFHSLVGLAAVATSVSSYLAHGAADPVALTATFLGALIGTITMTGLHTSCLCLA